MPNSLISYTIQFYYQVYLNNVVFLVEKDSSPEAQQTEPKLLLRVTVVSFLIKIMSSGPAYKAIRMRCQH